MDKYKEFKFGDYRVVFGQDYDDCPDISYLGKVVDCWQKGALPIAYKGYNRGEYTHYESRPDNDSSRISKWFVPMETLQEIRDWYMAMPTDTEHSQKYQGKSRKEAVETARKQVLWDYNRFLDRGNNWWMLVLSVHIYYKGVELGSQYVGSVESDSGDEYLMETYQDMLLEALSEADKTVESVAGFNRDYVLVEKV